MPPALPDGFAATFDRVAVAVEVAALSVVLADEPSLQASTPSRGRKSRFAEVDKVVVGPPAAGIEIRARAAADVFGDCGQAVRMAFVSTCWLTRPGVLSRMDVFVAAAQR